MNLQYARAVSSDAQVIFEQLKALIDAYEDVRSIRYDRVLHWSFQQIIAHIDQTTVLLADGQRAGYYTLLPSEDGRIELDNFFVLPEFRNRGVGSSALQHILEATRSPIFLYCFTQNTRALKLYARTGFRIVERVGNTRCVLQREHLEGKNAK